MTCTKPQFHGDLYLFSAALAIGRIERLQRIWRPGGFRRRRIPKALGVPHASLVLKEGIRADGEVLEQANPAFTTTMTELTAFARR